MPEVPGGDLVTLRTTPQSSRMFLVVQQPLRYDTDGETYNTADAIWYGVVRTAPVADPIVLIEVTADAGAAGATILDGMTVFISAVAHGGGGRGIVRAHGDQTIAGGGANDTLYIAVSSDLSDVEVGDFIVVLDEFRYWNRYPRITESEGDLTWYKDFGRFRDNIGAGTEALLWSQLGGADAARRQAAMPAVPIMGPHAVAFIDPDVGNVDIDFDWSDSYAIAPGGTVNAWDSDGEDDHAGGTWNDNVENPAAKTYSTISGLRGFRVWLELGTDLQDPIVEFVRGVRFVFTLRRPEELQSGDPSDAAPITDFEVDTISGSFGSGGWRTSVRVFNSQASEFLILPGALVILFTEDRYGGTLGSVGPDSITLAGRENIVFVGAIANDTIEQDSETGDVTFDVVSISEVMKNRENYSVPIDNEDDADEWYKTPDLTVDRAAHHYLTWHTNLKLVADLYQTDNTDEIRGMEFLAADVYSSIDRFIQDRIFARLLCDRFGRFKMDIDQQMEVAGAAATLFTLANTDWVSEITGEQALEEPVSMVDLGGLNYDAGTIVPWLSHAPGEVSKYLGTPAQSMSLALTSQAVLNTLSGRLLAYRNNQWPRLTISLAGNWRVADIWPQEYIVHSLVLERHTFTADEFLVRDIQFEYDASVGALMTTVMIEMETDGPDGVTVDVPEDLPDPPDPGGPDVEPPTPGPEFFDTGRRIISCNKGVFVTDQFGDAVPVWYEVNTGVTGGQEYCWKIFRDPWHWWTSGGTEKTLWGIFGDEGDVDISKYVYKHENFPDGVWVEIMDADDLGMDIDPPYGIFDLVATIEVEDKLMLIGAISADAFPKAFYAQTVDGGDNWSVPVPIGNPVNVDTTWPKVPFTLGTALHSAAQTIYVYRTISGTQLDVIISTNGGTTFPTTRATNGTFNGIIHGRGLIPYGGVAEDDSYIYALVDTLDNSVKALQVSKDFGVTWTNIASWKTGNMRINAFAEYTWDRDVLAVLVSGKEHFQDAFIYYTDDAGDSWTLWQNLGNMRVGWGALFEFNDDGTLAGVTYYDITNSRMMYATGGANTNKTGNLIAVSGGIDNVSSVERDTLGAA